MISIIIPVYNAEKYLKKCLDSILSQTYKDFEVILINDGSIDDSKKICEEYQKKDKRFKLINKENGGPSSARNLGLKSAKGEYISLVDADDYLRDDFYEKLVASIEKNNSDIAFCKYVFSFNNEIKFIEEIGLNKFVLDKDLKHFFESRDHINAYLVRCLYKSEIFKDIKYDENIKYLEDLDLFLRIMQKNLTFSLVDEAMYYYVQSPNSITRKMDINMLNNYEKGMLKCIEDLLKLDKIDYINSLKFNCFIIANNYYSESKDKLTLAEFNKKYNSKENYKAYRKCNTTMKNKIVSFLARHKILWAYKILRKMQKS